MFDRMRRICLVFVNVVFVLGIYAQQSDSLQINKKNRQDKTAVLRMSKSIKPFYTVELSDMLFGRITTAVTSICIDWILPTEGLLIAFYLQIL